MNMIESFNQTIDYLESQLTGDIDEKKVAQLSGYSYAMFSRIFSIFTGMTLSEYLRYRRMTEAGLELRSSKIKVIDLAFKYGYDSPDSFTTAFKSFHSFTPSEVRKGQPIRTFSKLKLRLRVQGGSDMNITIQRKAAFSVAGVDKESIPNSKCPSVWEELYQKQNHDDLVELGNGQSFGVCHDIDNVDAINYMAAYDVENKKLAQKMGLTILEIAEADYAVVELKGPIPACIHAGWKYLMEEFFPQNHLMHSGAPDFEVYAEGDMSSPDYRMELWVPVVKA